MADRNSSLIALEMQPRKSDIFASEGIAATDSLYTDYYDQGRWQEMIKFAEGDIASFVKELPSPLVSEFTLYHLYFGAQGFKGMGENDKYLGCLKILFSLLPHQHRFGARYQRLISSGATEYEQARNQFGTDYLNNLEVVGLYKKTGCFIATAVYGSPFVPELLVLRDFRDRFLLRSTLGRNLVSIYYWVSPVVAAFLENHRLFSVVLKGLVLEPLIWVLKRLPQDERSGKR